LPKQIGTIVEAAFQKFYADIQPQLFSSSFNIERQHGACDYVRFFVFQCFSPVIVTQPGQAGIEY
jgi:hypothetical protein